MPWRRMGISGYARPVGLGAQREDDSAGFASPVRKSLHDSFYLKDAETIELKLLGIWYGPQRIG